MQNWDESRNLEKCHKNAIFESRQRRENRHKLRFHFIFCHDNVEKMNTKNNFQKMMKKHDTILLIKRTNLTAFVFPPVTILLRKRPQKLGFRHTRMCRTLVIHPTKKGGYTTSKKSKSMPLLIQYHSNPIKLIRNGNFNTTIPYKTKVRIGDGRDHG